ncbi:MAG TPA: hypothetical protein PL010_17560, partial [Flavobacteriales bacterium]|nr:hypothetical protein [Flavobacteriales bacterium]
CSTICPFGRSDGNRGSPTIFGRCDDEKLFVVFTCSITPYGNPDRISAIYPADHPPTIPFNMALPASTVFRFQQKIFVKGERLRKRYRCKCLNDRRIYHIDPTVEVQLEQTTPVRRAS